MSKYKLYRVCPNCGNHLDWGERCDCEEKREAAGETAQSAAQPAAQETRKNYDKPVLMLGA